MKIINQRKYQLLAMERGLRSEQNSLAKKRIQIRNRLRKDEIQDYFEKRRKELLQYRQPSYPISHCGQLDTLENRQFFLSRIQSELEHSSPDNWGRILEQIKISIPFFEGNFDAWTEGKIVLILFSVFNSQSSQLGIQHEIIKIITSILNCSANLSCNFSGHLVYHHKVEEVIVFMKNFKVPLQQVKDFLHFFACICRINHKIRLDLINSLGAGDLLISYGKDLLQSELCSVQELRYAFLGLCGDYLTIFPFEKLVLDPTFQMALFLLVVEYIELRGSERVIKQGLHSLLLLAKRSNQKVIKGFEQMSLLRQLFQFSRLTEYRIFTLNILSYLACRGSEILIKHLYQLDIFQLLFDINYEERNYKFLNLTINMINNLVFQQSQIQNLLKHPVWSLVFNAILHSVHKIREDAYHCINSLVNSADSQNLRLSIVQSGKIIESMINQLVEFRHYSSQVTREVLILMNRYIQILVDQKWIRKLHTLESIFRLSQILDDVVSECQNDKTVEQALTTSLVFAQACMVNDIN